MAHLTLDDVTIIAAAIANARGNRRGVPTITNVLDVLPRKLRDEVIDDAQAVVRAINAADASTIEAQNEKALASLGRLTESLHRSGFR
jgi:hypothetical protein